VSDIVILDTGVFLRVLAGYDEEGRVYQKIIRRCDRVAIGDDLLDEYKRTLKHKFPGLVDYQIATRLSELKSLGKLIKTVPVPAPLPDIDDEDRHLIVAAKSARATYLITTNRRHLWDKRDHIKKSHHVEVLRPEDYLRLA